MKNWRKILEKMFMAMTFAEAGEHETAMAVAGIQPDPVRPGRWFKAVESTFVAVAFAEAGCPETALDFMAKPGLRPGEQSLYDFLRNVGLQGVQIRYGLVTAG
jgi:hypothetical protein